MLVVYNKEKVERIYFQSNVSYNFSLCIYIFYINRRFLKDILIHIGTVTKLSVPQ